MSLRLLTAALFGVCVNLPLPAAAAPLACSDTDELLKEASRLRGLAVKRGVPCKVSDQEGVRKYLLEVIGKQLPPERLKNEEFVYKKLGLFPEDYDYGHGIVELYLSQIGAYYDPERDHYVMAGWLSAEMQKEITVHELTHALQDQHYDLLKTIDYKSENGDQMLGRAALVEGDATLVMLDHTRQRAGAKGGVSSMEVNAFTVGGVLESSMRSSKSAPRSLQMLLIFPYTSGLRFVHAITAKQGGYRALDKVFANPPSSSEEILHPEKYGTGKRDFIELNEAAVRDAGVPADFTMRYQDTLGEFGISALLSGHSLKDITPADAAAGWGGDRVMLFGDSAGNQKIAWRSSWDTENDAREFFEAYIQVVSQKFADGSRRGDEWIRDGGAGKLTISGSQINLILDFKSAEEKKS